MPHTEAPSATQCDIHGAVSTGPPPPTQHLPLSYTDNITDSEAVVAAAESHGAAGQTIINFGRLTNCVNHNKERLGELLGRLTDSN